MNQQMGLTEFFAMEAGEYLERLDSLVSGALGPDRDELVRLARALRGSALMANQQPIGTIAAALESLARAVKEDRVAWDEASKQTAIGAVDGLKILIRSVGSWGPAEDARAQRIAVELATASGIPNQEPLAPSEPSVDTGTRAFVAREGAAVASVLNQTAKTLQHEGSSTRQLETVIRSMEPLRGLAALSELSPLPEYLDGVEKAITTAAHGVDRPNDLALFLDVAARGLSKAAQEIGTTGTAEHESTEAREFTSKLAELLAIDPAVVPIQSLYFEDEGPHIIESGSRPSLPGQIGQMEFVAHGEHLCQLADGLERAQWDTQREIRTISLKSTLLALTAAKGSSVAEAVAAFATAVTDALSVGSLERFKGDFITRLREAGNVLGSTTADEQTLVTELATISEAFRQLPQTTAVEPIEDVESNDGPISRPPAPSATFPIEPEALDTATGQDDAVESELAPPETVEPVNPEVIEHPELSAPEPVVDEAGEEIVDVAAGWAAYEDLRSRLGDRDLAIEELIAGPPSYAEQATAGPSVEQTTQEAEDTEIISIRELCYSGSTALEEASCVRDRIRNELAESEWNAALITDLIDELLDLVELGVGQT